MMSFNIIFGIRLQNNATGYWKTYLLGTSKLLKNSIENHYNFFSNKPFFPDLDKATIKPSCNEISYQKLFFLGDMDDCIRLTNVPKR